jgi:molybdopterin converting factor subunit 1
MVSVRLFAGFREKIDRDRVEIPVSSETTLSEFIEILGGNFPEIGEIIKNNQATIAVNHEIVEMDHPINDEDEIALFPPVSGG